MDDSVEKCLQRLRAEKRAQMQRKLIELGLYDKIYSEDGEWSREYSEEDTSTDPPRYYKLVAKQVTEDEYREICALTKPTDYTPEYIAEGIPYTKENSVAKALMVIAYIIYIGGFLIGSYSGSQNTFTDAFNAWISAFISGTFFLGFAEIIHLLDNLCHKKYRIRIHH